MSDTSKKMDVEVDDLSEVNNKTISSSCTCGVPANEGKVKSSHVENIQYDNIDQYSSDGSHDVDGIE